MLLCYTLYHIHDFNIYFTNLFWRKLFHQSSRIKFRVSPGLRRPGPGPTWHSVGEFLVPLKRILSHAPVQFDHQLLSFHVANGTLWHCSNNATIIYSFSLQTAASADDEWLNEHGASITRRLWRKLLSSSYVDQTLKLWFLLWCYRDFIYPRCVLPTESTLACDLLQRPGTIGPFHLLAAQEVIGPNTKLTSKPPSARQE
jgi:hypothetical protein